MPYKIGILGAAGIAPRSMVQPCARNHEADCHAVASRRPEAGQAFAGQNDIPVVHGSYEDLLADPDIDIVYIALSPAAHAEWSIKALQAGKHVLCEKPIGMTADEARRMMEVSSQTGRLLMEAFHDRYHPAFLHILHLKESGRIGRIRRLHAEFCVDVPYDPKNIRYDPVQGGGAMMDLGCYPLHWLRNLTGAEPEIRSANAEYTPLDVDRRVSAQLRFPGGIEATMLADLSDPPFRGLLRIEGDNGIVELDNPCLPHKGHSVREWLDGGFREYTLGGGTTYDYQLKALLEAVAQERAPVTSRGDSIGNMEAVDRIYELLRQARQATPCDLKAVKACR